MLGVGSTSVTSLSAPFSAKDPRVMDLLPRDIGLDRGGLYPE